MAIVKKLRIVSERVKTHLTRVKRLKTVKAEDQVTTKCRNSESGSNYRIT